MEVDGSRSWEEDIYWNHFQFIHFTQFLKTTDFQQQLVSIPFILFLFLFPSMLIKIKPLYSVHTWVLSTIHELQCLNLPIFSILYLF